MLDFISLHARLSSAKMGFSCFGCQSVCCPGGGRDIVMVLLPGEKEYLRSIGIRFHNVKRWKRQIEYVDKCPFSKNGLCKINSTNPIDCRTFPVIPSTLNGVVMSVISSRCPRSDKLEPTYQQTVESVWTDIFAEMSQSWKDAFVDFDEHFGVE